MGQKRVVVEFTPAEARGLLACAEDGAEGLLTDAAARSAYIGGPASVAACWRGLAKLSAAVDACSACRRRRVRQDT